MKKWFNNIQALCLLLLTFTSLHALGGGHVSNHQEASKYRTNGASSLPTVYVPETFRDIATPAAVNNGPGKLADVVALIKKGDETKDKTYYQQALGILQRIKQRPVFPGKKISKADMYNLLGYTTQMLSKTRTEYMTAEDFYHKALLIDPDHIQANKNLGKLYADLFRITGRDKYMESAEERAKVLNNLFSRTESALMSLQNDINSFTEQEQQDGPAQNVLDPDSNWYTTSFRGEE